MVYRVDEVDPLTLYMAEVGDHTILSDDEELALFRQLDRLCPDRLSRAVEDIPEACMPIIETLMRHNLKLVVKRAGYHAKEWTDKGDLISEGNLGLLRGIWGYDQAKKTVLSTYAVIWIDQAIRRALAIKFRKIRMPVQEWDRYNKALAFIYQFEMANGREPTIEEIAEGITMPKDCKDPVKAIANTLKQGAFTQTVSLDAPIREGSEQTHHDFTEDAAAVAEEAADRRVCQAQIEALLDTLTAREAKIISMRFGLGDTQPMTLEQVAQQFGLTRERIRQIQWEALRKLRHPSRARKLRGFAE